MSDLSAWDIRPSGGEPPIRLSLGNEVVYLSVYQARALRDRLDAAAAAACRGVDRATEIKDQARHVAADTKIEGPVAP